MHDIPPLKLAARAAPRWEQASIPAHVVDVDAVYVKTHPDHSNDLIKQFGLPERVRSAPAEEAEALWLGPGEWLLLGPSASSALLRSQASSQTTAVVQVGDKLTVLGLSLDSHMAQLLTGLPASALANGTVARTRLADVPVIIYAQLCGQYYLIVDTTFAHHIRMWLDRAI